MAEEYKYRITIKTDEPITACNDCIHVFVCKKSMFKQHFAKCPDYEERRKTGKWESVDLDNFRKYKMVCPFCKSEYVDNYDGYIDAYAFNFCPNCGAKMDEENKDETQRER